MTIERLGDCIESLARACGLATNGMEKKTDYKEILRLAKMLSDADIPYQISELHGGYHIIYPSSSECVCSVVEHTFSYSAEKDLLEIMGLLTEQEKAEDVCDESSVKGNFPAEDVFERIRKHYAENYKNGRTTA